MLEKTSKIREKLNSLYNKEIVQKLSVSKKLHIHFFIDYFSNRGIERHSLYNPLYKSNKVKFPNRRARLLGVKSGLPRKFVYPGTIVSNYFDDSKVNISKKLYLFFFAMGFGKF